MYTTLEERRFCGSVQIKRSPNHQERNDSAVKYRLGIYICRLSNVNKKKYKQRQTLRRMVKSIFLEKMASASSVFVMIAAICSQIDSLSAFSYTSIRFPITQPQFSNSITKVPVHTILRYKPASIVMAKTIPRDVKETVNQLRQSMQSGLSARCSRMDIELPFAVNFGVERAKADSKALQVY